MADQFVSGRRWQLARRCPRIEIRPDAKPDRRFLRCADGRLNRLARIVYLSSLHAVEFREWLSSSSENALRGSFSPIRSAEEDAQSQIRTRVLDQARTLEDGESRRIEITPKPGSLTVRHGLGLLRGLLSDRDRLDDNLATGKTRLSTGFAGTISRSGDEIAVDGGIDYDWRDRYDFHSGQPGADAALSLQEFRGVRPFGFGGRWRQRLSGTIERRRDRLLPKLGLDDVD